MSHPVRLCSVQYGLRPVASFQAFADQVESFVDVGDDYDVDLVVFPELLTTQLLSSLPRAVTPYEAMQELANRCTHARDALFTRLADEYHRIIVAGSHPRFIEGQLQNVASIYVPGQAPVHQPKIHLTPTERKLWGFEPGSEIHVVETNFGRFGVSICYDVQFPEIARLMCEHGAQLLVVPYLTDDRRGHTRVTTCARARAVENQIYVATAGMVGSLPLIPALTSQYAQSGIYTPADFSFPHDGVATEAAAASEMAIVADLDFALLDRARTGGSVQNYEDAAMDGLHIRFDGEVVVDERLWLEKEVPAH